MKFKISVSARPVESYETGEPAFIYTVKPLNVDGEPGRTGYAENAEDAKVQAQTWADMYASSCDALGVWEYTPTRGPLRESWKRVNVH